MTRLQAPFGSTQRRDHRTVDRLKAVPARTGAPLRVVILGLTITSSWGNGHATTYRSLVRALHRCGHSVLFLENDRPWYRAARDMPDAPWCDIQLYSEVTELADRFATAISEADVVLLGSYVPDGIAVGRLVHRLARGATAFYDIDTPVTIAALQNGDCTYLAPDLIPAFDLYLSFTGGPTLRYLEHRFGARAARALYCSADPENCRPEPGAEFCWDMSYLGTFSPDRQPGIESLLCATAREWRAGRFAVAGSQYPAGVSWPENCERIVHLPPAAHRDFYNASRFTLNVTRREMVHLGFSPSVRLFEAACCGTPVITDLWPGLETVFLPGIEILTASSQADVTAILRGLPELRRAEIATRARLRVLQNHTGDHRAAELLGHVRAILDSRTATKCALLQ